MTIAAPVEAKNPYPGLRPFEPRDAAYYFGRDRQVDELLLRLRDHRFVAVVGLSGSGKSSLVRAGLIPALKAGHLTSSGSRWQTALFRPGSQPIEALAAALDQALGVEPDRVGQLRTSTNALLLSTRSGRRANDNLLVVVDQFEEIFRVSSTRDAAHFVDVLLAPEQDLSPAFRVYVVLTMRTDRLGECAAFEGLPEALNRSQYLVPKLTGDELRDAIEGPAALTDTTVAPELVQRLVIEAGEGHDQLPLLQHLLMTLWDIRETGHEGSALISLAQYQLARSAAEALNCHADRVLADLKPEAQQHLAARIFRALVDVSAGRDQRRSLRLSRLAEETGAAPEEVRAVIEHFYAANFLTSPDRGRTEDWEVDITHESLIRQWKELSAWVAEEAKDAEDYRYFAQRAQRRAGALRGGDLALARKWVAKNHNAAWAGRYDGDFDETIRYIRRSRLNAALLGGFIVLTVAVIVVLAIYAWRSSIRANQEKQRADTALAEAEENRKLADIRRDEAIRERIRAEAEASRAKRAEAEAMAQFLNANEEKHHAQTALARSAVQDGIRLFDERRREQAAAYFARALRIAPDSLSATSWISDLLLNSVWWVPSARLPHENRVNSAVFSSDGRRVVTASEDKTARVWEADTGKPMAAPLRHQAPVYSAEFSRDGRRVLTRCADRTAWVWEGDTSKLVGVPMQHPGEVNSAAFSPDGRRVVTASEDNTARVWEADSGKRVGATLQHQAPVYSAVFSSDGRRVVTASEDNTARVWEADTGKPVGAPLRHQDRVNFATFSPDGRRVVTASRDKTARVWEADTGKPVGAPLQHQHWVYSAAFSPDGRRVVTASEDKTARVWDADTGKPVGARLEHQAGVYSAVFSPDSRRVVTASSDRTRWVWDANTGKPAGVPLEYRATLDFPTFSPNGNSLVSRGYTARLWKASTANPVGTILLHDSLVESAAFSPDGRLVVTASEDKAARVWEADTGKPVSAPLKHQDKVNSAAFSPDGRRVVTASRDKTARVWEADTGKVVGVPMQHQGEVNSAAFSPDGRRVVTASRDKTARVWEADSGKPVGVPLQHQELVYSAAFSPEGQRVVTASEDKTARVWSAETGRPQGPPLQHESWVQFAAFSPNGHRIVTASWDGTARVWDAQTGKPVGEPLKHQNKVLSAAFSPDGRRVVTASVDNTARVWEADTGKPVGEPLQHQDVVNSAAFSPDGRAIVTASLDKTVRVWEADTRKRLGAPLLHESWVKSAAFSPDGRRVITASWHEGRIWNVLLACCTSKQEADRLADLMESVSGYQVSDTGSLSFIGLDEQRRRLAELGRFPKTSSAPLLSFAWIIDKFSYSLRSGQE